MEQTRKRRSLLYKSLLNYRAVLVIRSYIYDLLEFILRCCTDYFIGSAAFEDKLKTISKRSTMILQDRIMNTGCSLFVASSCGKIQSSSVVSYA